MEKRHSVWLRPCGGGSWEIELYNEKGYQPVVGKSFVGTDGFHEALIDRLQLMGQRYVRLLPDMDAPNQTHEHRRFVVITEPIIAEEEHSSGSAGVTYNNP